MDDTVGPNNTNAFNILHLIKVRIVNCEQLLLALWINDAMLKPDRQQSHLLYTDKQNNSS